ncbi:putative N-acetyl-LL-diaminopimelate aminotransferase [Tepidimonas sediminis]|uniref:Aminotransferase n=1 Tax=Tepidimonas sediminis TaxID=2588941 RepID=A0A554WSX0_9BURK|nr:pyridoxal phosphate-dependent aminotransferase [Tepidimonas sediminis]TSE26676.1 putative N-acetyl-LL-diaminopimelate aminotransferase [Tepidimonas sediminis]
MSTTPLPTPSPSARARAVAPFLVMQVAKEAAALAATLPPAAPRMLHLNIGEPDFGAPAAVQAAAQAAIRAGHTPYTPALGLDALRERLSAWYAQRFGLSVPASRIVITAGASAGLQLAALALFDAGNEVLLPDPCYPCNRQILASLGVTPTLLPTAAATRYQPTAAQLDAAWGSRTRGVMLASPANPTGTSIDAAALRGVLDTVRRRGGALVIDEIYLGLSFDARFGQSALALGEDVISVNSFSKYFGMTGWRLGWLVLPEPLVPVVERLAQNHYICANTLAQHAALACFEPETLAECEHRRAEYAARRDAFVPALRALGFEVPVEPDGAFYVWADASPLFARAGVTDSQGFVRAMMERTQVVVTPSPDFGAADGGRFVRFSLATAHADLEEAIARLRRWLG